MAWRDDREARLLYLRERRRKFPEKVKEERRRSYQKHKAKRVAEMREYRKGNAPQIRDRARQRLYGISEADYQKILRAQNGVCAICLRPPRGIGKNIYHRLYIDHDHETGRIRELLCEMCNFAIGAANDSIEILMKMALYLEKHKNKPA